MYEGLNESQFAQDGRTMRNKDVRWVSMHLPIYANSLFSLLIHRLPVNFVSFLHSGFLGDALQDAMGQIWGYTPNSANLDLVRLSDLAMVLLLNV